MKLFAVRDMKSKAPIGFFWAADLIRLAEMVDAYEDVEDCEYKRVPGPAAIVWDCDARDAPQWKMGTKDGPLADPARDDDGEGYEARAATVKAGLVFESDYELSDFVKGACEIKGWKPLLPADEPTVRERHPAYQYAKAAGLDPHSPAADHAVAKLRERMAMRAPDLRKRPKLVK
jgi:hypothetical protein